MGSKVEPGPAPESAKQHGYDAITSKGRRAAPISATKAEGKQLDPYGRQKLTATTRDLVRNFSVAKWMIARHLDYTSFFSFTPTTKDKGFNAYLSSVVADLGRAERFDAAGRHRLESFFRLCEARRIIDGDVGVLKVSSGPGTGSVMAIEADRIRNPSDARNFVKKPAGSGSRSSWVNGVKVNDSGRTLAYSIWNRDQGGSNFVDPRDIRGGRLWLYGFFDSSYRFDQVRGISPLASAANQLKDAMESSEFAILKAKSQAFFSLVLSRDAEESAGDITGGAAADQPEDKSGIDVDFGAGPVLLDLLPGEDAKFLQSNEPSDQFKNYMNYTLEAAMKALNISPSMYSSEKSTWHGSRSDQLAYDRGCLAAREDHRNLRDKWTVWRLTLAILDGELDLPSGWTLEDVRWEWVHRGTPWWRPDQEIKGDIDAIGAGFSNPMRVCRERGQGEFEQNLDATIRAVKYARERGLEELGEPIRLNFELPPEATPEATPQPDEPGEE